MPRHRHPDTASRRPQQAFVVCTIAALLGTLSLPADAVIVLDTSAFAYAQDVTGSERRAFDTATDPSAVISRFQSTATNGLAAATSTLSALADPRTSTLRVYAQGTDSGVGSTIEAEARFDKQIFVDSSTLAAGSAARLRFDFKFDGLSTVIPNNFGARALGSVETTLDWRLTDPGTLICNEGCFPVSPATFGYESKLLVDTKYNEREWEAYWTGQSNATSYFEVEEILSGSNSYVTRIPAFSLVVDAFVGQTLDISATLSVFAQMNLPSSVLGNFRNTFDVEATPETSGVFLVGEQPGLSAVSDGGPLPIPEPGTWALMLAGLAALAGLRARRA